MDDDAGAWGILNILDGDQVVILDSPEAGLIHLAWESRMFDLFCTLTVNQTEELTRVVTEGMSKPELVAAMSNLVSGREIVHKLRGEVHDLPGIASLVASLDQLEAAIADRGLSWERR